MGRAELVLTSDDMRSVPFSWNVFTNEFTDHSESHLDLPLVEGRMMQDGTLSGLIIRYHPSYTEPATTQAIDGLSK